MILFNTNRPERGFLMGKTMIRITTNVESIIARAQSIGLIAGMNQKPGSNRRGPLPEDRTITAKPFVINGKRLSWSQAKQYLAARGA